MLVNLGTGETIDADDAPLRELGYPERFVLAENVSVEEWVEALQRANERGNQSTSY
jgi:hypothetical protein